MRLNAFLILVCCLLGGFPLALRAQQSGDNPLLKEINLEDRIALRALVLYPREIGQAAAELALSPSALVNTQHLQARSEGRFQELLAPHDQKVQEGVYRVLAMPGLLDTLLAGGPRKGKALKTIARKYPQAWKASIMQMGGKHYELLQAAQAQIHAAEAAFEGLKSNYPVEVQQALEQLLDYPEVLNLMGENPSAVVLLGDFYRKDRESLSGLRQESEEKLKQAYEKELQDWLAACNGDALAREELLEAASAFCLEMGLERVPMEKSWFYEMTETLGYEQLPSFPYWAGFPWWYDYPYWKMYPCFYHTGFYQDAAKSFHLIATPSYPFLYFLHAHGGEYPHARDLCRRFFREQGETGTTFSLVMALYESKNAGLPEPGAATGGETSQASLSPVPLISAFRIFKAVDYHWISWDYGLK